MKISEGFECFHRFHAGFGWVARVFAVEHRIVWWRRQIGRVGVHVSQEEEKRFVARGQAFQFGQCHFVEQFGFAQRTLVPTSPRSEVHIFIKAARTRISRKAHTHGFIAFCAQNFRQGCDVFCQSAAVAQCHDIGGKTIHARQHGGIGRCGGNMRAECVFEQDALCGKFVNMRRREPVITIATHVI